MKCYYFQLIIIIFRGFPNLREKYKTKYQNITNSPKLIRCIRENYICMKNTITLTSDKKREKKHNFIDLV